MTRPICAALRLFVLVLPRMLRAACFFSCELSEPPAYAADSGVQENPVSTNELLTQDTSLDYS